MPTAWDDFEPVTEEPSASTNWSDFEPEAPEVPKIKLDPYQQYRLSGREPVAGPFGPAHPEEVLSMAQAAQQPIIPLPDTQAKGPLAAAYRSVVKPVVEGIESPAGILMAPLLAESVPLRVAAGAAFGGLAAKSGIEKMQSDDPQTQLEGRMELAGSPLLALLPGGRDKVAPEVTERPQVNLEAIPKVEPEVTPEPISEQAPPAATTGEAQPSEDPGGATVETPVSAGETPQAKGEVATSPPEPQAPTVTEGVTEPPFIGMGGEVYGGLEPPKGTPTSTKNAVVDQERVKRGLPPAIQPAREAFGEVWERAMARIDREPEYPDNLISELDKHPRAANPDENATLLHRQIDLQNEYAKATRDLAQAFEDGRQEAVDSEKVRVSNISDQLQKLYDIDKKVGTAAGRALNVRRMMANEDFTLAKMTSDQRAAKGGAPLTPEESLEIKRLHDKIAATQQAFDEHVAKSRVKIADLQKQLEDELQAQLSDEQKTAAKKVRTAFDKLSPEEKAQATVDAVKQRVADKKPEEITFFVQRLARDLVARGVRNRDKLIDAVHEVLQQAIPEITKRQTMDAISGYGDFKQLSKDEISVALRGMKGEMQQLAKLEDMAKGEPPKKSGTERRTPTDAERALIKEVNEAKFKFQVPVQDPATQLKSALDTLKTTLTNRIKDYEDRIARGDYSARPKRELVLDPEASRLKAQNERVKKEFQKGVELERFKNAQPFERGAHWINKWRRGFILSSPITLAKLTAAAAQRMAFTPVEEAVGSAYSKAFPGLAGRAPREGGFSPSAETSAITRGITEGMRDAWDLIRTGESDLDAMYGKTSSLPGSFLDFFGRVHGALKSSTKRAEFTRSMQKRIEFGRRNGVDVTDPWVQMKMGVEAYKDANRSIFMQDNRVVSAYRRFIGALEQKSKITGEVPASGKAAATAARVLLPIVKVPTNIVAETLDYALGTVTGGTRLARAYAKGIDQLKPEEADLIMRQLKKGSLGLAVMTLGFLNPNVVGGYYQRGEKRKPGDAKVGSIQVYGHNVPSFLLHNPLLETAQIGATARRVADAHRSRSTEKKWLGEGLYAAAVGLGEEVPFVREMAETTKAFDPTQKNAFWGELGKSLVIPQAVQWIASHYDTNAKGQPIARSPKTTLQHIETGIPGLREKVPKKKGQ